MSLAPRQHVASLCKWSSIELGQRNISFPAKLIDRFVLSCQKQNSVIHLVVTNYYLVLLVSFDLSWIDLDNFINTLNKFSVPPVKYIRAYLCVSYQYFPSRRQHPCLPTCSKFEEIGTRIGIATHRPESYDLLLLHYFFPVFLMCCSPLFVP